jgi:hypothetical protein
MNIYNYSSFLLCVSTIDYSTTTIGTPSGCNSVTGDNSGNLYFTSIRTKDITRYNIGSGTSTTFFSNPSLIAGGFLIHCFVANDGFVYALNNAGSIYKISSNGIDCALFLNAGAISMCYNSLNTNIYASNVIGDGNGVIYEITPSATSTSFRSGLPGSISGVGNAPYLLIFYNVYDNTIYWTKRSDGVIYNIAFSTSALSFSNVSTNLFTNGNNVLQIYKDGVAFGSPIVDRLGRALRMGHLISTFAHYRRAQACRRGSGSSAAGLEEQPDACSFLRMVLIYFHF